MVEHARVRRGVRARRAPDRRLIDVDDLVEVLDAGDRLVQPGRMLRPVDLLHQRLLEDVVDQRGLPGARHAGDGDERAERERDVDVLEVVLAPPFTTSCSPLPGRRFSGTGILRLPLRYWPVIDSLDLSNPLNGPS